MGTWSEGNEEKLFELATHLNPTVVYLCNEIEKSDRAFRDFQAKAKVNLSVLTKEWKALK